MGTNNLPLPKSPQKLSNQQQRHGKMINFRKLQGRIGFWGANHGAERID
jgi:hypothetical protein